MKGVVWLILLILIPNAYAWEQYQGDLLNSGKAEGIGDFNNFKGNMTISHGYNFQPLVSDLDNDGNNEIAVFSNDTLKIFDKKLNEVASGKFGIIQGQPTIFDADNDSLKEIIFISNHSLMPYFFAYEYTNFTFKQEFNFSVLNGAIGSGVKCMGSANLCIFMDNSQYIHTVNMTSRSNSSYNTSVFRDTNEKIPAIGDIDNDGSLEAVFWFDVNGNGDYGLLAFNLGNGSLDTDFNSLGYVDDVYSSFEKERQALKGHPVLVDLNKDNKIEIAVSVFYDDSLPGNLNDWYTKIIVYNYSGSLLFSDCEERSGSSQGDCSDSSSDTSGIGSKWEGTNPFVLDSNNDGMDEICFIKDKKESSQFKNMTINCYNYSGSMLLDSEISPTRIPIKSATAADMNNDGIMEVITPNNIYALNGTSIFNFGFDSNFIIPADIDGNGGLDLVWSKTNQTTILLDNTSYTFDLHIDEKDILFGKNGTKIGIHNNGNGFIEDFGILALNIDTMENWTGIGSVRGSSNVTIELNMTFDEGETLLVQLDYEDKIEETDEKNNFAFRKFDGFPFAYVSADLEPDRIEEEFIDYIKDSLKSSYFTNDEDEASVKIYIGKNNILNKQKSAFTRFNFDYYYDFGNIYYKDKVGSIPYNGLISAYKEDNGVMNILIYGNNVEGNIAAVKEFIANEADFTNAAKEYSFFIDDENLAAVKVFDFLHNAGNEDNYLLDNNAFKQIVRNAIRDEMFSQRDYSVVSDSGVSLRLRNLKPNASSMYLLYLNSSGVPVELPVVLAHGLFSNLSTWQVLGSEISNSGRDTWLIEITGGPGQDCDSCPDYTFNDLTDDYLPALLNGVLDLTDKENIQYVGFSNGCRTALDSLERNEFDSDKIETFVAVGCPGAFEGLDVGASGINLLNERINKNLQNKSHISFKDMFVTGIFNFNTVSKNTEKISMNLWEQYDDWISSNEDNQPGNIIINNFIIIHGNADGTSDIIVTVLDEKNIYDSISVNDTKRRFNVIATHIDLDGKPVTKNLIKKSINKEELNSLERNINLVESD